MEIAGRPAKKAKTKPTKTMPAGGEKVFHTFYVQSVWINKDDKVVGASCAGNFIIMLSMLQQSYNVAAYFQSLARRPKGHKARQRRSVVHLIGTR